MSRLEAIARPVSLSVFGTGSALPGDSISTERLLQMAAPYVGSKELRLSLRVARRLNINARHVARHFNQAVEGPREQDTAPHLAARAIHAALASSGCDSGSIQFLLGHTATPQTLLPANTAWVADLMGYRGPHTELRQACTGFAMATVLADALCRTSIGPIAIVGSELGSTLFDPSMIAKDRSQLVNLVQMGDGAGAILLGTLGCRDASRIEYAYFGSNGLARDPGLMIPYGGSGSPRVPNGGVPHFRHLTDDIRAQGVDLLQAGLTICADAGFNRDNVAWWIPHQANGRMADVCSRELGLPRERVVCEADMLGNLGSAAIWVALDRLRRSGRLTRGDRVVVLGAEATKYMFGGLVYVHGQEC